MKRTPVPHPLILILAGAAAFIAGVVEISDSAPSGGAEAAVGVCSIGLGIMTWLKLRERWRGADPWASGRPPRDSTAGEL